jgi:hypothetical protein
MIRYVEQKSAGGFQFIAWAFLKPLHQVDMKKGVKYW